jgi:hypothetical protein
MQYRIVIHKDFSGRVTMDLVDEDGAILVNSVELPRHGADALVHGGTISAVVNVGGNGAENPGRLNHLTGPSQDIKPGLYRLDEATAVDLDD